MTPTLDDYDLRLCANCGTELGPFEKGPRCHDCANLRTRRPRRHR
ncbi:hypothetical protein GA0070609_6549 [Micromonospora echinaurantiaca]|uniref:Uncharacterized protein n=1 Tax=Micromonospora echinaurantiaca TaxID=47857 RepID=A0A1C5KE10_9ACTN|nr:hypothetical protein GA0070609_6549 [Micromonospora echinaurantiaca]